MVRPARPVIRPRGHQGQSFSSSRPCYISAHATAATAAAAEHHSDKCQPVPTERAAHAHWLRVSVFSERESQKEKREREKVWSPRKRERRERWWCHSWCRRRRPTLRTTPVCRLPPTSKTEREERKRGVRPVGYTSPQHPPSPLSFPPLLSVPDKCSKPGRSGLDGHLFPQAERCKEVLHTGGGSPEDLRTAEVSAVMTHQFIIKC